ncbi:MAG: hypothetical protein BWX86_02449 [Verrucomicrobia bacterium ADurb.Bin122]|nr:MAG: hypothetical protein BWX86_02449 [Verrucomicrobia bacterium ADurb.Bin122]
MAVGGRLGFGVGAQCVEGFGAAAQIVEVVQRWQDGVRGDLRAALTEQAEEADEHRIERAEADDEQARKRGGCGVGTAGGAELGELEGRVRLRGGPRGEGVVEFAPEVALPGLGVAGALVGGGGAGGRGLAGGPLLDDLGAEMGVLVELVGDQAGEGKEVARGAVGAGEAELRGKLVHVRE